MSHGFGQTSLEVLSIRRALAYSKKRPIVKKSKNDLRIVFLLTQLPYAVRKVNLDERVYKLVQEVDRIYTKQLIFNGRLPLELLVHRLVQNSVPEYAPYSEKILDSRAKYGKYDLVWGRVSEVLDISNPVNPVEADV